MTGWGVAPRVRHPAGACYAQLGVLFIGVLFIGVLFIGVLFIGVLAVLVLFILVLGRCFVLMADDALDTGARRLLICASV